MSQYKKRLPKRDPGTFSELFQNLQLIFKLMGDKRVPFLLKLLPVAGLTWLLVPDLAPGPVDDVLAVYLTCYLFIELSPKNVVNELRKTLREKNDDDSVDGDWKDI